jgi:small subunit ribosomal protein S3
LRDVQQDLKISESNSKQTIKYLNFLKVFIYFLQKKGIWALNTTMHANSSFCKIYFNIFFTTKIIKVYKKRLLKLVTADKILSPSVSNKISEYLPKILRFSSQKKYIQLGKLLDIFLKHNLYFFSFKNLNIQLKKSVLLYFHKRLGKYKNVLFKRRHNLYFDCLKIVSLLYQKLISVSYFLFVLSNIFKYLSKKLHGRFLTFVSVLIYSTVESIYSGQDSQAQQCYGTLKGIKFKISGKLKGKMRAGTHLIRYGRIPNQSIDVAVEYAMLHTYTRYGVFGMQIWLQK